MKILKKLFLSKGQSLIELLLALGLSSILLPAMLTGLVASREGKAQQSQRLEATSFLDETAEALRNYREKDWSLFAVNGTFHPAISSGSWTLIPGSENINGYSRQVVIGDVFRNNGSIVTSGGTLDPSTKKAMVTISWNTPFPSQVESTLYLTRFANAAFTQTTAEDFNQGIKTNVVVTNTQGGEVALGAGGSGNWCNPNLSIAALDLPKQGVANAISAIEGKVFAATGDNASGVSYATVDISNTKPPVATLENTYNGFKTNGVFGENNYAYLATDTNNKEVEIINISQAPYSEAGYFDAPGNGNASSVFVAGDIGYATDADKLYTFDLSSKAGSRPKLGEAQLAGAANKVVVVGSYAYVVTSSTLVQLQIVQISPDGRTLTVVGQARLNSQAGKDVFINSTTTRAYVASAASETQRELFIVDISSKTGDRPTLGSYDTLGMDPKGVVVVPGNRIIIVGIKAEEYQAIDISNEATPTRCGGLNIDTGVNGISAVPEQDGDAYSYIITGDASAELKIIEGGPGGQYTLSGTFESSTFDAGKDVAFNSFEANATIPSQASLTYQVSAQHANSQTNDCNSLTFNYVGPDGTSNTYFATSGTIPLSSDQIGFENPGRCFRYKAFLSTTDPTQAPILWDISFNYSL